MKGQIQLIHQVPGRLRIRVAPMRHNQRAAAILESRLQAAEGIYSVTTNTAAGSLVINYDAERTGPQAILASLGEIHFPAGASGDSIGETIAPWLAKTLLEMAIERSVFLLLAAVL